MLSKQRQGKSARTKGYAYENEIAHVLSDWYGEGGSFIRVPQGQDERVKSLDYDADVTGIPKTKCNYVFECKRYEGWEIENLLLGNKDFPSWISQAIREGETVNKIPTLVFRRNHHQSYITLPYNSKLIKLLDTYIVKGITYESERTGNINQVKTVTCFLDDLCKLSYDKINNIYNNLDWNKQIVTVKKRKAKASSENPSTLVTDILSKLEVSK